MKKLNGLSGFKAAIPIMIGYVPVAMTFGILARNNGLTYLETVSFSLILYAGASQFIGLSMIAAGAGFGEIVLATFLLNFRHFFMSASLISKLHDMSKYKGIILGFGITDEVFSVASFAGGQLSERYLFSLELFSYLSWITGTAVGFSMGSFLPKTLQIAMGIGLFALFASILVPEFKKSSRALVLSALAGGVNSVMNLLIKLPQGWSLVLTIVLVSLFGVVIYTKEEEVVYE
ncbi:MAG: AzlC family ABC transporter permease [Clostridiales bacterium]|nr:AzlC family ABC transporter permease [Clostridiales bacterium]